MNIEAVGREAIDCGYHVHKELGPGLLESVYEVVLAKYLAKRGLRVERQRPITLH
jgi:GxxExxY protein